MSARAVIAYAVGLALSLISFVAGQQSESAGGFSLWLMFAAAICLATLVLMQLRRA